MGTKRLDVKLLRDLSALVENLTHSGEKELNPQDLQNVKDICKLDPGYVDHALPLLFNYLEEKHSEVRCSCVQLLNELFLESERVREEVCENLDLVMRLTLGVKSKEALPPPAKAVELLKRLAISAIKTWHSRYGEDSVSIKLAYDYLRLALHVDFDLLQIVDPKERARREEEEKKQMTINRERLAKTNQEMEEMSEEVENTVTSLETCFSLLIPDPAESNDEASTSRGPPGDRRIDMRLYGVSNPNQIQLDLQIDSKIVIEENEENAAILENTNDLIRLINNRLLPKTKAWVQIIAKAEGGPATLKKALAQKAKLEKALSKYDKLEILKASRDEAVSSDSELEEVAPLPAPTSKPRYTADFNFLAVEYPGADKKDSGKKKVEEDRTNRKEKRESCRRSSKGRGESRKKEERCGGTRKEEKCGETRKEEKCGETRKEKLLAVAPKIPFDVDLYHWEDEKLPTPTLMPTSCEGHRFWSATNEEVGEVPVPGGASTLRSRVIEFTGEFEKVERACRAPLPSGLLCPRHDRIRCPFHGLIVERDPLGRVVHPEDEEKVRKPSASVPDWQDPRLLADIEASTGVDLRMPEKGKGKKKKKYPGLTDLKAKADTPASRIAKKVFNRGSMRRVATTMDRLDHKRFRDKYGDQFNYVHDTS